MDSQSLRYIYLYKERERRRWEKERDFELGGGGGLTMAESFGWLDSREFFQNISWGKGTVNVPTEIFCSAELHSAANERVDYRGIFICTNLNTIGRITHWISWCSAIEDNNGCCLFGKRTSANSADVAHKKLHFMSFARHRHASELIHIGMEQAINKFDSALILCGKQLRVAFPWHDPTWDIEIHQLRGASLSRFIAGPYRQCL